MNVQIITRNGQAIVECLPDGQQLASEDDALELIAACGENDTPRLLLHAENLPADFYRLSTGLAGRLLLKFSNYRLRVAAVLPLELTRQGRFHEMVLETNRGNEFRVFQDREAAEQWLVEG